MMKRSIVTTEVAEFERAMSRDGEGDCATLVGAKHGDTMRPEPRQCFRRGMPVAILRPDTDDRVGGLQLLEPAVRGRAP